ncbi:MAG: hypothetical protein NTV81_02555 [Candidatus Komeilibacteria bacterium]|nr:hypothetical protein [Candidatus Komeilibacteria bacterium]
MIAFATSASLAEITGSLRLQHLGNATQIGVLPNWNLDRAWNGLTFSPLLFISPTEGDLGLGLKYSDPGSSKPWVWLTGDILFKPSANYMTHYQAGIFAGANNGQIEIVTQNTLSKGNNRGFNTATNTGTDKAFDRTWITYHVSTETWVGLQAELTLNEAKRSIAYWGPRIGIDFGPTIKVDMFYGVILTDPDKRATSPSYARLWIWWKIPKK